MPESNQGRIGGLQLKFKGGQTKEKIIEQLTSLLDAIENEIEIESYRSVNLYLHMADKNQEMLALVKNNNYLRILKIDENTPPIKNLADLGVTIVPVSELETIKEKKICPKVVNDTGNASRKENSKTNPIKQICENISSEFLDKFDILISCNYRGVQRGSAKCCMIRHVCRMLSQLIFFQGTPTFTANHPQVSFAKYPQATLRAAVAYLF